MGLVVGTTRRNKQVMLTEDDRECHIHIVGASGRGKSKLLESMIRQDILAGRGLCLIDPHGTLADPIVTWCASRGLQNFRKVHVVKPADLEWSAAFNPLRLDGVTEPSVRVDTMVAACAQVWGGENLSQTPLLKKCLRAVFYALAVRELTLVEALELTRSNDPDAVRRRLTENLPDYLFDGLWQEFNASSRSQFQEDFRSTTNRLSEFLSSPIVRRIVGQREHALDLKQIMDCGEILIVNFAASGALSHDNTRLLGTLLTSELFLLALSRTPAMAKRRPFSLYIDECYKFLTSDIEDMLDQTRKFGLHVVLSHQRLSQLGKPGDRIYNGVMAGGQTKIVFGGLEDGDAEVMARQVMRETFDLERPKHSLDRPVVVDEVPFWLESESSTDGRSSSWSSSESSSSGSSAGSSEGALEREDGQIVSLSGGLSSGNTEGSSRSTGVSGGTSHTDTRGRSQTLKPERVLMTSAVHSLEEETHRAILKLRKLPKRAAVVKRPTRVAVQIQTPVINPILASSEGVASFLETTRTASPYLARTAIADEEIAKRQAGLRGAMPKNSRGEEPFWQEE